MGGDLYYFTYDNNSVSNIALLIFIAIFVSLSFYDCFAIRGLSFDWKTTGLLRDCLLLQVIYVFSVQH